MKYIFLVFIIIGFPFSKIKGQPNTAHPTILSLKVSYKSVAQTTTTSVTDIKGIPQGTITLSPSANISKIYFKILDNVTKAVLYEVNYPLNSPTVINNLGKKLFDKVGNTLYVSNGSALVLVPYKYQLQTEDNLGNLSPLFTITN